MAPARHWLPSGFPASYACRQSFGLDLHWLSVPTSHEQFVLLYNAGFCGLAPRLPRSHEVSNVSIFLNNYKSKVNSYIIQGLRVTKKQNLSVPYVKTITPSSFNNLIPSFTKFTCALQSRSWMVWQTGHSQVRTAKSFVSGF